MPDPAFNRIRFPSAIRQRFCKKPSEVLQGEHKSGCAERTPSPNRAWNLYNCRLSSNSWARHSDRCPRNNYKGKQNCNCFYRSKKTQLNLHDLGPLWAYCKLCNPAEEFLLSSAGIGSLNKILNNLSRTDLLDFGDGRKIKKMQIAKWDVIANSVDYRSLVPRI